MKTRFILLAALALSACANKTELPEPEVLHWTVRASQEGSGMTRTAVHDGGTQVYWEPADEIKVFFRGFDGRFVSQNTEDVTVTEFAGTINVLAGATEGATSSNLIWGLYPYRADAVSDGESVTTTLPAMQEGKAGSFARNVFITVAQSIGLDLAFYNVCGGLRFSLSGEGVKTVSLEGNNGEVLAGKVKLAFEDGVPVVAEVLEGLGKVTLSAPDGGTFQPGVWYYLVTLPGALDQGYKITLTTGTSVGSRQSGNAVTIHRGRFGSIGNINDGVVFTSLPDAVDLGLPSGTLWASFNLGASAPAEIGGRYAWGELSPKPYYDWSNYKWCNGTAYSMTKYCTSSSYGTVDGKTLLDPEDDAAIMLLGDGWHMPTRAQMEELVSACTWTSATVDGVSGQRVTGSNGNSIFLPNNGQYDENGLEWKNQVFLWTSECMGDEFAFRSNYLNYFGSSRLSYANHKHDGLCIRPVRGSEPPVGPSDPDQPIEAVDLGLPSGVKWGSANVGASAPEAAGDYFAWGEVLPRGEVPGGAYAWSIYKWCNGGYSVMLKYNTNPSSGQADGRTVLEKEDDAATAALGGYWRMPRYEEMEELQQLCTWTWTTRNGHPGYEVVSSVNGNSIFLPAAGYKGDYSGINEADQVGLYWSSSLSRTQNQMHTAYRLRFTDSEMDKLTINRSFALQVRPVWEELPAPEAVDLGLSVKWASMNLGATVPEQTGQFFAWGETIAKNWYGLENYRWCNGSESTFTKYCTRQEYGDVDNLAVLDAYDDAAHVKLGGSWRMPTLAECQELLDGCTWTWTTRNGVNGYDVQSRSNGNTIFFPATGYIGAGDYWVNKGYSGQLWASTYVEERPNVAYIQEFDPGGSWTNSHERKDGLQVRPVCE